MLVRTVGAFPFAGCCATAAAAAACCSILGSGAGGPFSPFARVMAEMTELVSEADDVWEMRLARRLDSDEDS